MTRTDHTSAPSAMLWNAVMPALGIALLLGASLLPALALAAVASLAIVAVSGQRSR
jgi:hypothetical protein